MPLIVQDLRFGGVVRYNPEKLYGFIQSEEGKKVFFHLHGEGSPKVTTNPGGPYSGFWRELRLQAGWCVKRTPKVGDQLYFVEDINEEGRNAPIWVYRESWMEEVEQILSLRFLVVRKTVVRTKNEWRVRPLEAIFKGTLAEMEEQFPAGTSDDLLASISDPALQLTHRFCYLEKGWVECADPRTKSYQTI